MFDFSIPRTVGIVLRTWPFVLLRMAIYFGITVVYIFAMGAGAGLGYGIGHVSSDPDVPFSLAFYGSFAGFVFVSVAVYWLREYLLYIVKAGHIAVMVRLIDGQRVPDGKSQLDYGRAVVTERFMQANTLFVLDQLVKGVIGAVTGLVGGIAAFLPLPGVQGILGFVNTVIRLSLTYVDEVILGLLIREDSRSPFETAQRGVVLYAQNARVMIRNAVALSVIMWGLAFVIFVLALAPAGAFLYAMPGQIGGWGFVLAVVFAWACKVAFLEPFAIAALTEVYFRTIAGQQPDPAWTARLAGASEKFRQLGQKAAATAPVPARA